MVSDHKTRIIETAEVMFADHGFEGLTIRELADALGVNVATIHYHYGSKRELYQAAMTRSFARQRATVHRLLNRCNEIGELNPKRFARLLDTFIDDLLETTNRHPWAARNFVRWALTRGKGDPLFDGAPGEPVMPQLQQILDRASRNGIIEPTNAGALAAGLVWTGYGYFAAHTKHAREALKPVELCDLRTQLRNYTFGTLNLTELMPT